MNLHPYFVIIPLGTAFVMPILARVWKGFPDLLGNLVCAATMALSIYTMQFSSESQVYYVGGWEPVNGIPIGITMVIDGFTVLMLLVINIIGFLVTLYSISYMNHYTDKGKYYTLFLLMISGLNGVVLAGDMFNLFVFLEIAAIASYSLVAYGVEAEELEASFKYQILGGTASALILFGIALFYFLTGTLNFADASQILAQKGPSPALIFIGILFLTGFGLKAALMPFHAWLPDAHPSAPAPISAMLSGVVIKVLGLYALVRIFFNVFGISSIPMLSTVLIVIGTLSMVAGAVLALGQKDMKRLLAYSSISQIGYIVFAFGIGTPLAVLGGLFHLINHAVFKSLLFMDSGAVIYTTNNRNMSQLGGLSQKMVVTGVTALTGSLSISGLPPLNGFWSKLVIVLAAVEDNQFILAIIAILVGVITLAYYLKVVRSVFYGELNAKYTHIKEVPVPMCIPMVLLALLCVGMGILLIPQIKEIVLEPAVKVICSGVAHADMGLGG